MNKENKKNIAIPPTLPTDSLWNACGFKNSLSKRESKKNIFEYFATKKVKNKLIREKIIKKFTLNSNIYLLYFFTI